MFPADKTTCVAFLAKFGVMYSAQFCYLFMGEKRRENEQENTFGSFCSILCFNDVA